jgi:hypothetical protein
MARETITAHFRVEVVCVCGLGLMALRARCDAGILEALALVVVAFLARDVVLLDVRAVPRARFELLPCGRNELGGDAEAAIAQRVHDEYRERGERKDGDERCDRGLRSPSNELGHARAERHVPVP